MRDNDYETISHRTCFFVGFILGLASGLTLMMVQS